MKISAINLKNIRGFVDTGIIKLSDKINIFIGPNNSGKSTLIKSIYLLQNPAALSGKDIRIGEGKSTVALGISNINEQDIRDNAPLGDPNYFQEVYFDIAGDQVRPYLRHRNSNQHNNNFRLFPNREPNNLIYPFLSKRKVTKFNQLINRENKETINEDFTNLNSKIDRFTNPDLPGTKEFRTYCSDILSFTVSAYASGDGKEAGLTINEFKNISMELMGEGTPNLLALFADLCIADSKIFLIEEPENDIHPAALKYLLDLIIEKSKTNQFFISTHSNIVTKILGAQSDCKIFHVTMVLNDKIPTSSVRYIGESPDDRIAVLREMGYELADFDLWEGYLILEESTTERVIRDFLIPEFTPNLRFKLRTIASKGIDDVTPRFNSFHGLFTFIHLQPAYKNRGWVIVDGDNPGKKEIEELIKTFPSWPKDHFLYFSKENFEEYYPLRFKGKAEAILRMTDKKEKLDEKGKLVQEIIEWTEKDKENAKKEFKKSASEVIDKLSQIDNALKNTLIKGGIGEGSN